MVLIWFFISLMFLFSLGEGYIFRRWYFILFFYFLIILNGLSMMKRIKVRFMKVSVVVLL